MKIIDRIFEYIKYKGVTVAEFERKNSLSNGYLRKMKQRNADIGETIIVTILENCPDLSVLWFVLGSGSMLKSETVSVSSDETSPGTLNTSLNTLKGILEGHASDIDMLKNEVANIKKRLENG